MICNKTVGSLFVLGLVFAGPTRADPPRVEKIHNRLREVNVGLHQVLRNWNVQGSSVALTVEDIDLQPSRIALSGSYRVNRLPGRARGLNARLKEFKFTAAQNGSAELAARGEIGVRWLECMDRTQWDHWAKLVQEVVQNKMRDHFLSYGDAARVETHTGRTEFTREGRVRTIAIESSGEVDLSQVPSGSLRDNLVFSSVRFNATATLNGLSFDLTAVENPDHKSREVQRERFRTFLIQLLSLETPALQALVDFVRGFDGWVRKEWVCE